MEEGGEDVMGGAKARGRNWKVRERLVGVGNGGAERDEWRRGVMNGGPLSVTDGMANYSWSALQCTAGGAYSVLSGRRISLHPPFALRG